ncbi:MAG: lipoprotein-releasing ABC transporter permease subunit [Bauldia sp.]
MREPTGTRPFARFEWLIALRYLRARRRETFISIISVISLIGITLGVATLIIVLSVMNGFRAELIDRILGINGHIVVEPIGSDLTDYDTVAQRIAAVPGVVAAVPLVEGQVLATGPNGAGTGALIRGVREADLDSVPGLAGNIIAGTLDGWDASTGVAIGSGLAVLLGVGVGDSITVLSPDGEATPFGVTPRRQFYPVNAIFEIGMSEYDAAFVFLPFPEAQTFFNMTGQASSIEIYVEDPDLVGEMRPAIAEAMERQGSIVDWRQRNVSFFQALDIERNVMFLILTLIVLVAALNIVSGLTMLVKEKGPNIAILRTLGATRGAIMRIFFVTGAAIGTVGTLLGLGLGVVVTLNIEAIRTFIARVTGTQLFSPEFYYLSQLPAELDPGEVTMVVAMALILSYLATAYPAWRAARLDPVEALRYE